jgi:hypothetical protein
VFLVRRDFQCPSADATASQYREVDFVHVS